MATEFTDFLTQEISVPAWVWIFATGCMVYCLFQIAAYVAKRKWRDIGSVTDEDSSM